ncbi:sensor domain-containing diguanylate cyclase [Imbroritus primus]|uniref:sensor domain-containing diguanylate cyclase n=1 Tax=Imbroritus primus TaxID=3058603 RepID=UPI003D1619CE
MDPLLNRLSESYAAARSTEELTRPLLEMLSEVTGLESTYLTSIDLDRNVQHVRFARNTGDMTIPEGLTVPWEDTLCKRALDEERMFTDHVAACWGDSDAARQLGIQTYLSTPVRSVSGALLGTLCGASADRRSVDERAVKLLRLFSTLVGNFLERELLLDHLQAANRQLAHHAMTDTLTGLPNRRALFETLSQLIMRARAECRSVLVVMIDLDHFKQINDTYGHQCGDLFLREIGQRLQAAVRQTDMLARIGGDEFAVVGLGPRFTAAAAAEGPCIEHSEARAALQACRQRLLGTTIGEFVLGDHVVAYAGASVGGVILNPDDLDPDRALCHADERMYADKRLRRHGQALARPGLG